MRGAPIALHSVCSRAFGRLRSRESRLSRAALVCPGREPFVALAQTIGRGRIPHTPWGGMSGLTPKPGGSGGLRRPAILGSEDAQGVGADDGVSSPLRLELGV